MMAIINRVEPRTGVETTYLKPSWSWPLARGTGGVMMQFVGAHHAEHDHHGDVRNPIDDEAGRQPNGGDQRPGDGRSDDARQVDQGRIQA